MNDLHKKARRELSLFALSVQFIFSHISLDYEFAKYEHVQFDILQITFIRLIINFKSSSNISRLGNFSMKDKIRHWKNGEPTRGLQNGG